MLEFVGVGTYVVVCGCRYLCCGCVGVGPYVAWLCGCRC